MKKSLLFAAALTMLFASCTKNNDEVKTLEAEFTLETVSELPYGEPVQLSGSFTSTTAISKAVFTGAKKQRTAHSQLWVRPRKEPLKELLLL